MNKRPVISVSFDATAGPAVADHVLITAASGSVVAGEAVELHLRVVDAFGNSVSEEVTTELEATGSLGGAPSLDGQGASVTVQLDSAGTGVVGLVGTRAELVTVRVVAARDEGGVDLPEKVAHGEAEVLVIPREPYYLRLASETQEGYACEPPGMERARSTQPSRSWRFGRQTTQLTVSSKEARARFRRPVIV